MIDQTNDIFEIMSKGQFICSNSSDQKQSHLYDVVEENFETLSEYFNYINFTLERGNEYFYFSKKEIKADLERKIELAYKWIDIVDFLKTFDSAFTAGYRFTPSDVLVRLNVDAVLKTKLEGLRRYSKEDKHADSIRKIIDMLCREGFAELENAISESYKMLSSFHYLENLILSIQIPEETQNEIPE